MTACLRGRVDALLYRSVYRARFSPARSRQLPPSFGFAAGDVGEAMGLECLPMNTFSRQPHLLGEFACLRQDAAMGRLGIGWWFGHACLRDANQANYAASPAFLLWVLEIAELSSLNDG